MSQAPSGTEKLTLCPYCGHAQYGGDRCQACSGLFEPLSRRATQLAMGPWQVRDKNQPFRPGFCYDVLQSMAKSGKIKPTTILRGPTTRQFWSVARNVPGVSHLIGYCHECGEHVSPSDAKCGECGAIFEEPRERNALGLLFKTDQEAEVGQRMLDAEIRGETVPDQSVPGPTKHQQPVNTGDLLGNVLDLPSEAGPTSASTPSPDIASPTAPVPPAPLAASMPTSAFDIEPTRELPEPAGMSTVALLMIGLNVIAIATIVVLWIMLR